MEIAAQVGETLLSAVLSKVFDTMASPDLLKFARTEKVEDEIKKWRKKLIVINAVLADAEDKQLESEAVKNWLRDLKDLVYDVEDILDEFNYEALRCKFTSNSQAGTSAKSQASTSKVRALIPSCFTSLSPSVVTSNIRIGSKLEEITARLEEIVKEKNDLALIENVGGKSTKMKGKLPTTSLVDKSGVYGREGDKEAIIELLLGGEASNEFSVIPIVGMGGLGKTTLAQLAYSDDRVRAHFELRAWVCVSEDFDIFKITKAIWQYVTSEACPSENISLLHEKPQDKLSGKKFLIILDDVWNENDAEWKALCNPLKTGVPGCKLVITTRNDSVVSITGAISTYRLQQLLDEDCLSILEKHALGAKCFDDFPNLKEIGMDIAKKCKGLPLAVQTLGGLLRRTQTFDEWKAILKSEMWDLPERKSDILPALRLSYHYLPACLKRCFAYCSLFPKDYEFEKNELVSLWMAEGFLQRPKGKKEIEELGYEYFDELLSRSFFQQSSADETKYVMHDLMNDLAKFVAEQEQVYFWLGDKVGDCEEYNIMKKLVIHHLLVWVMMSQKDLKFFLI